MAGNPLPSLPSGAQGFCPWPCSPRHPFDVAVVVSEPSPLQQQQQQQQGLSFSDAGMRYGQQPVSEASSSNNSHHNSIATTQTILHQANSPSLCSTGSSSGPDTKLVSERCPRPCWGQKGDPLAGFSEPNSGREAAPLGGGRKAGRMDCSEAAAPGKVRGGRREAAQPRAEEEESQEVATP